MRLEKFKSNVFGKNTLERMLCIPYHFQRCIIWGSSTLNAAKFDHLVKEWLSDLEMRSNIFVFEISHLMALISIGDPYLSHLLHWGLQNGDFPYANMTLWIDFFLKHTQENISFFPLFNVNMDFCVLIYSICFNGS